MSLLLAIVTFAALPVAAQSAADQRLSNAALLAFSGKQEEARPRVEAALKAYHDEGNAFGEGVSHVLLGIIDIAAEKPAAARVRFEKGANLLQEAGDFVTALMALWMIAESDTGEGHLEDSLSSHARALATLDAAVNSDLPFRMDGVILLGPAIGMDPNLLTLVQSSAEMLKPMLLQMMEAMIRDSYGHVLTEAGRLDDAAAQLTQAKRAGAMLGIFDQSIEAHFGDLRRRQWRFDEARKHYEKSLKRILPVPVIPDRDEWLLVHSLGKLAEIEQLSGHLEESLKWNDQALAVVRKSGNRRREARVLEARGDLLLGLSRFDDAEKAFKEGLLIAESLPALYEQATLNSSLGNLYLLRGDFGRAAATLEKSIGLFGHTNSAVVEAATLLSLAEVYIALGAQDSARAAMERARTLAREKQFALAERYVDVVAAMCDWMSDKHGSNREFAVALSKWWELPDAAGLMMPAEFRSLMRQSVGLDEELPATAISEGEKARSSQFPHLGTMRSFFEGKRLFNRGDIHGARAAWSKALQSNSSKELTAPLHGAIGATYWAEGKTKEATAQFEQAVQAVGLAISDVKVEELLAGYLGNERRWFFDIAVHGLVAQQRYEDAFDYAERARARALLNSLANMRLQPTQGADASLVASAEVLRKRITEWQKTAVIGGAETADDLLQARKEYQSVLKRLKASNPEYASLTTVEPLRISDIQQALPEATTLVSYFVGVDTIHAWVVERDSMKYVALPVKAERLRSLVCWAKRMDEDAGTRSMSPERGSDCKDDVTATDAYDLLFSPLRPHVHHNRLIIVPHGGLHYVPFVALRDRQTNRFLLQDYTVSFSPSASALKFLRDKETPVNGGVLVLGDPAVQDGGRLQGAQEEAISVASRFGVAPKVGAAATESALYGLRGEYDIVHIAAHALYDADVPLFSHVALARDDREDGRLEVNDILSRVDFTGVNLVVLSACGTARGARSGGDEIVGLTRAVLYAGAPGVISTLWDVHDDATAALMTDFYAQLRTGASVAEALRTAQLNLMQRKPYAEPQYWAAFELTGDPRGRWAAVGQ
ncbi:MAG TPA: CHAT domain-containing protein [Thermoanaerobaculia bacterium]|nr:CHAT domain-containing protein [Thermoanaerobaculia bacterium]